MFCLNYLTLLTQSIESVIICIFYSIPRKTYLVFSNLIWLVIDSTTLLFQVSCSPLSLPAFRFYQSSPLRYMIIFSLKNFISSPRGSELLFSHYHCDSVTFSYFYHHHSLVMFRSFELPSFWDCKGKKVFLFCKLFFIFFVCPFSVSQYPFR